MWSLAWDAKTQERAKIQADQISGSVYELPLKRSSTKRSIVKEKEGSFAANYGREKLFSKMVTQSDIKQYRLAIPKKQVKKHFPLHVARKGDLFSMVDNEGKVWKFRFSFWKSTQTWVFTGGWNLFVKEKGLNMGDMVSFLRSSTGPNQRLYIDWEPKAKSDIVPFVPFQQTGQVVKLFGVNISTNMNE